MELMRELGKDDCNGSEGLFGAESSRGGCRDSRAKGLEVAMGSILERQGETQEEELGEARVGHSGTSEWE